MSSTKCSKNYAFLRKYKLYNAAASAVETLGPHYILSVRSVATEIAFNCGDYCTQYLISGGIECSYS